MSDMVHSLENFKTWKLTGAMLDGAEIREDGEWGVGVFEHQSGLIVSPIAYSVRQNMRRMFGSAIGDKT